MLSSVVPRRGAALLVKFLPRILLVGLTASPVWAGHDWGGLDLCRAFPERMPPPLDPMLRPDPEGTGARLLGYYCGQCHHAPGPGQHSAAEWADVLARMGLVMEATARFAAQFRPVVLPEPEDWAALLLYLQSHALRPLARPEEAPPAYRVLCGDCHAAPDPAAYPAASWPKLLARMTDYRPAMARPAADPADQAQVFTFLGVQQVLVGGPDPARPDAPSTERYGRWLALGPVFALVLLGLARWGRGYGKRA